MRYFKDPNNNVYGYDETIPAQAALMQAQAITAGWTEVTGSWPAPMTLQAAQATQSAILNAAYNTAIAAPVSFTTAAGTTSTFSQTDTAKNNLRDCLQPGASNWTLNLWVDTTGVPITPFTYADLQGLSAAMEAYDVPKFTELLSLLSQVQSATTIAQVQAIVWS